MRWRRAAVGLVPALAPASMTLLFAALARRLSRRTAYNVGFAVYWLGWCTAFPLAVAGPRRAAQLLLAGRASAALELTALTVPVVGAVVTELVPNRRDVDPAVAAVMVTTGVVNAVGEELLWRGLFLAEYGDDVLLGALWPLAGFALWHLAPQTVLPSRHGRLTFVAGAALVGAASTASAWRSRGLRNCLLPHAVTDSCGVAAARFRLGR